MALYVRRPRRDEVRSCSGELNMCNGVYYTGLVLLTAQRKIQLTLGNVKIVYRLLKIQLTILLPDSTKQDPVFP